MTNSDTQTPYVPKKSPVLLILVIALLALLVAFSFYLGLRKSAIETERATLSGEIVQLKAEIQGLEGSRVEAAQSAQAWIDQVKKREILWSSVITRIGSLLPFDAVTQSYKVQILSYSGGEGGRLSLNATTRATAGDPYPDAADLIEVFNDSSYFSNGYVPSLTRGEDDQGRKLATFLFNVMYQEEAPSASVSPEAATEESAEAAAAEEAARVPRQ